MVIKNGVSGNLNHLMKSLVELIKWLIKFAILLFGLILCAYGAGWIFHNVEKATSSKLIASIVGLIVIVSLFKVLSKVGEKLFDSTFLKEGGKDDYERALFRSTWGELVGYGFLSLIYGGVTVGTLSFFLPDSLMESIFHWSLNSESSGDIWTVFTFIVVGGLFGILINRDMRDNVMKYFK